MPERAAMGLTARSLIVGLAIGVVLSASNVFIGLKLGFYEPGAITAAVLGYAVLVVLGRAPSSTESLGLATCASSAAVMAATTGLLGPVTAMVMLGADVSMWAIVAWALALAVLGVVLALPLRAPLVTDGGGLPFPTGRATAEVIASMVAARMAGARRVRALLAAAVTAATVTWFRDGRPDVIPQSVPLPGRVGGHSLESLTVSIGVSPLLMAAGALIGLRNGVSIVLGAVVAWVVLAPRLIDGGLVASADFPDLVAWLLWPGAALLVASTLTSLVLQWRTLVRGVADLGRAGAGGRGGLALVVGAGAAAFAIGWLALDVHPAAAAIGVALAPILAAACARAEGETDLAPVGPIGGVAQIALGPVTPANPIATLGGGAIVNGVAAQTSQMMYAFRAGAILGVPPRVLVAAQLVGAAVGAGAAVVAYELLTRAYHLGSEVLPAGAALSWKATAEAVAGGVSAMPAGAPVAAAIAAAAGIVLTLVGRTRAARYLPAPVALGTAFLIPASYAIPIFLGAAAYAGLRRAWPTAVDDHGPAVAAGGIAGEAIVGIVIAVLTVLGVLGDAA